MSLFTQAVGFGIVSASVLALAAVGFTLQFGVTNVLNLAFSEVMTTSAFVAYIVNRAGANIWVSMIAAAAAGALVSLGLNRGLYTPFIRRGTQLFGLVIVSIGAGLVIQNSVLAITGPKYFHYRIPHGTPVRILGTRFTTQQLEIIGVALVAMISVHVLLKYTKFGKAMRATSANASLARACGIHTSVVIDGAWAVSGILCGIAGVTLFLNTTSFSASTTGDFLVVIVAAAVLGGIGEAYGAMLGALVIGLATEIAAIWINPSYKLGVAFIALVLVLLVRPQGIKAAFSAARQVQA